MKKTLLAIALAATTFTANANDINIASGGEGGNYEWLAKKITGQISQQAEKKKVNFNFEVLNTNGSIENIELFNEGDANIAIVQADALNMLKPSESFKSKTAYTETVFWLYNKQHDKHDIEDIEGSDEYLMVIIDGSGADVTMQSFVAEDAGYKDNYENAIIAGDLYDAIDIVSEGTYNGKKVAGALYVGFSIPTEIATDFKSKVGIGEATDGDFNDATDINGNKLYKTCEIKKAQTSGMKVATWGSPDTVCLNSLVIYRDDFGGRKEQKIIKKAITKSVRGLK